MKPYTQPPLSPLGVMLQTSWIQVISAFSMLFRLMLVRWIIEGMLLGICIGLFVTAGSSTVVSHAVFVPSQPFSSYFPAFTSVNTTIFLGGVLVVALLYVITVCVLQIATIFAVSRAQSHASLAVLFHLSLSRIVPFVLSQILCFFLIVGGFFAFVLPGIGMLLFFTFVPFVVLFEGKSGFSAIRRGITLIANHWVSVMGRVLLLWVMGFLLNLLLASGPFYSMGQIMHTLLVVLINSCFWWYSTAYVYVLYKEAVAKSVVKKEQSLTQILLLSFAGWGIAVFVLISLYSAFSTLDFKTFFTPHIPSQAHNNSFLQDSSANEI